MAVNEPAGDNAGKGAVKQRSQTRTTPGGASAWTRRSIFPVLLLLSGCGAKPDCDTIEIRNAVLKSVSDNHRNPLLNYAEKNSTAKPTPENTAPLYQLGERIVTNSTSQDKRTLQCSGALSVSVGDIKASKEVDFMVQRSTDGKVSVSVVPFQF